MGNSFDDDGSQLLGKSKESDRSDKNANAIAVANISTSRKGSMGHKGNYRSGTTPVVDLSDVNPTITEGWRTVQLFTDRHAYIRHFLDYINDPSRFFSFTESAEMVNRCY